MILAACSTSSEAPTESFSGETAAPTIEPTQVPTPTATPLTGKVVLISSGDGSTEPALQTKASELAAASGLIFEQRSELLVAEIAADWQIVILATYAPALADALAAAPAVQFIVYSDQELGMSPNLNLIRLRPEYQAFIAGYLSTLITPDWRVGGVFPPGDAGARAIETYLNGGHYFCGICNSVLSPIVRFPVTATSAASSDSAVWQAEVDALLTNILYVMYVSPQPGSDAMLAYLAQKGFVLVGGETPPVELLPRWAATVRLDLLSPLEQVWPQVSAGQGGNVIETKVVITDINEEFYSSGRQRLVEQTLADLEGGWINPFNVPLE